MVIADVIQGFFSGVVKPVLDKWIPDAKDRLEAEQMVWKGLQSINLAQIEVNKEQAKHSSIFVAGARPFITWVCGVSLAYAVVGYTFLNWILAVVGVYAQVQVPTLPAPDTTITFQVLMGTLGMSGLRTYEKMQGVAR